jgi:predicted transcriptional regulator
MDTRRRERGSLEREVVAALAGASRPLSPGQVRDALGGGLAYTTVMTVLTRLADKGLVVRTRSGRGYVYGAVLDAAEVIARRMRRLLDSGDDRAAVLTRFVGGLTDEDEHVLVELLRAAGGAPASGDDRGAGERDRSEESGTRDSDGDVENR